MKKISIIIPAFNEEKYLKKIISKIKKINFKKINFNYDIIVVDDGSTDNSKKILKKTKGIKLLIQQNLGKGRAVQNGIKLSKADYILIQDADLEYFPEDIIKMLKKIKTTKIAIYGSRYLPLKYGVFPKRNKNQSFGPFVANIALMFLFWVLYRQKISDLLTGYKLYERNFFKRNRINTNGFETDHEISAKLVKKNYKIIEVPIKYRPRSIAEGKKINFFDGLKALKTIILFRFYN